MCDGNSSHVRIRAGRTAATGWRAGLLLSLGVLALNGGCQHQQLADKRFNERIAGMSFVLGTIADSEARRPSQMDYTLRVGLRQLDEDAYKLDRDLKLLDRYIREDVQRWIDRQPLYWREAERQLRGQPEKIEPNAINLFL